MNALAYSNTRRRDPYRDVNCVATEIFVNRSKIKNIELVYREPNRCIVPHDLGQNHIVLNIGFCSRSRSPSLGQLGRALCLILRLLFLILYYYSQMSLTSIFDGIEILGLGYAPFTRFRIGL